MFWNVSFKKLRNVSLTSFDQSLKLHESLIVRLCYQWVCNHIWAKRIENHWNINEYSSSFISSTTISPHKLMAWAEPLRSQDCKLPWVETQCGDNDWDGGAWTIQENSLVRALRTSTDPWNPKTLTTAKTKIQSCTTVGMPAGQHINMTSCSIIVLF